MRIVKHVGEYTISYIDMDKVVLMTISKSPHHAVDVHVYYDFEKGCTQLRFNSVQEASRWIDINYAQFEVKDTAIDTSKNTLEEEYNGQN